MPGRTYATLDEERLSSSRGHTQRVECVDIGVTTTSPLRFVVLGDSIAYGQGSDRPEDRVGPRVARELESHGLAVDLEVFAVPRATSRELGPQVQRAVTRRADLALIIIGANDLTRLVPPAQAAAMLGAAVQALRAAGATVLVVPAPDLSELAFLPPSVRPFVRRACRQLQEHQAAAAAAAGAEVAPVSAELSRAFASDPGLFSRDRYHPSSNGYARIAAAVSPFVVAAARSRTAALQPEH